jgi:polyferredoxin
VRIVDDGGVENTYRLQIANGTEQAQHYRVSVEGLPGLRIVAPAEVDVEGLRIRSLPLTVALAPTAADAYRGRANPIAFEITTSKNGLPSTRREQSTYFVPR